jgi:ribulose-bisphosphate carboxylase large chain
MSDRLNVTYRLRCTEEDAAARALGIALEQSTELPAGAEPESLHTLGLPGRVEELAPAAGESGAFDARISYPVGLLSPANVAGVFNLLFGNSSLQQDVTLLDADLSAAASLLPAGPRFGIQGIRAATGAAAGPLTCTALKPVGLGPGELARLAGRFARAGIHLIKDDHGLVDQAYAPFKDRLRLCQQAVLEANRATGGQSLYVPHVCGLPHIMVQQLDACRRKQIKGVMIAPMLVGPAVFEWIVWEAHVRGLFVLAHPALSGGRMAPEFLLGSLFRLLGADGVIFVNHGGRFGAPPESCAALALNLRKAAEGRKPALPIPAGGMSTDRVAEIVRFYGPDVALLISGALYPADGGLDGRARTFVQTTAAAGALLPAAAPEAGEGTQRL